MRYCVLAGICMAGMHIGSMFGRRFQGFSSLPQSLLLCMCLTCGAVVSTGTFKPPQACTKSKAMQTPGHSCSPPYCDSKSYSVLLLICLRDSLDAIAVLSQYKSNAVISKGFTFAPSLQAHMYLQAHTIMYFKRHVTGCQSSSRSVIRL